MMVYLIGVVSFAIRVIELVVIVHVLLSYFMSPYHPVRQTVDRFVEPMLAPIRRLMPAVGRLDFSPLILLLLVQVIGQLIVMLLQSLTF